MATITLKKRDKKSCDTFPIIHDTLQFWKRNLTCFLKSLKYTYRLNWLILCFVIRWWLYWLCTCLKCVAIAMPTIIKNTFSVFSAPNYVYILYRYSSVSFKCGHCIQLKFKVPFCQIRFLFEVPGSELFEFYTILLFQGICGQPEHFSNCEDWCGEDFSKIRQDCRHIHAQGKKFFINYKMRFWIFVAGFTRYNLRFQKLQRSA